MGKQTSTQLQEKDPGCYCSVKRIKKEKHSKTHKISQLSKWKTSKYQCVHFSKAWSILACTQAPLGQQSFFFSSTLKDMQNSGQISQATRNTERSEPQLPEPVHWADKIHSVVSCSRCGLTKGEACPRCMNCLKPADFADPLSHVSFLCLSDIRVQTVTRGIQGGTKSSFPGQAPTTLPSPTHKWPRSLQLFSLPGHLLCECLLQAPLPQE